MRLETITVRTTQVEGLIEGVSALIEDVAEVTDLSVAVFQRNPPINDLCIHLRWPSDRKSNAQPGIQLASVLSEYGSVDHAIWQEIEGFEADANEARQ